MRIKLLIALTFSILVALPPAKARAAEVIAGKDIIYPRNNCTYERIHASR